MKTFTATQLNKSALQVFREADKTGSVKINHDRYPDKVFVLEARERRADYEAIEAAAKMMGDIDINTSNRIMDTADGRIYTGEGE